MAEPQDDQSKSPAQRSAEEAEQKRVEAMKQVLREHDVPTGEEE